jgi:hypothetical protein
VSQQADAGQSRHVVLAEGSCAVNEVAKGFRQRRFFELSDRDKRDLLKLMARVAEQAYRRGVQQGAGLASKSSFRGDLWEWRYQPSLDLSPWVDSPTTITSLARLDAECGEQLRELGFPGDDGGGRCPSPVWTGYTAEQRRLIKGGNRAATLLRNAFKKHHNASSRSLGNPMSVRRSPTEAADAR